MRFLSGLFGVTSILAGCADPVEPVYADVDAALSAWEALAPAEYSFEVAVTSSWVPRTEFNRVHVRDGAVLSARGADGKDLAGYSVTIESIWTVILDARVGEELNSARFNAAGVPLAVDVGDWALDGGVAFLVRRFRVIQ